MLAHVENCGWMSWAMLVMGAGGVAVGIIGLVLGLVGMRRAGLAVSVAGALLAGAVFATGLLARARGRAAIDEILPMVEGEAASQVREQGYREAESCVTVGIAGGVAPAFVASAALLVAVLKKT